MSRASGPGIVITIVMLAATVAGRDASGHPWHRHRAHEPETQPGDDVAEAADTMPAGPRFILASAPGKPGNHAVDIAEAFAPFVKLNQVKTRRDERWFYVESNGIPDHPLMVGIRSWQQQVPLPQSYTAANAWQIPLHPVVAKAPASTKNRFLRGAIAVAVNGIPIFNPLNNRGEDALAIGELDDYGGHCGRADDYHYHVAPVHLEKIVGKGMPIAYALDGYPVYGSTEPDGSPLKPLDACGGHDDGDGGYHYHAMKDYPYLIGAFRGEVVERDGQVDPQPRAEPVRPALGPLRGATIVGFEAPAADTRKVVYDVGGRRGSVEYSVGTDGGARFTFTDPAGRTTTETYTPRRRGPRQPAPPPPPGERRARDGGGTGAFSGAARLAEREIVVRSPAFGPGEAMPREFTCDGAGVSPPVEWQPGPAGTKSYALTLWHESPDGVKSYWVVYDIPANVTQLPKGSRSIGTLGLTGRRRAEYDPMCSKGPGVKEYHITVYALAGRPQVDPAGATREGLLAAIGKRALAEGTLTFTYERKGQP